MRVEATSKKKNVGGENSKLENKKSCLCFPL